MLDMWCNEPVSLVPAVGRGSIKMCAHVRTRRREHYCYSKLFPFCDTNNSEPTTDSLTLLAYVRSVYFMFAQPHFCDGFLCRAVRQYYFVRQARTPRGALGAPCRCCL